MGNMTSLPQTDPTLQVSWDEYLLLVYILTGLIVLVQHVWYNYFFSHCHFALSFVFSICLGCYFHKKKVSRFCCLLYNVVIRPTKKLSSFNSRGIRVTGCCNWSLPRPINNRLCRPPQKVICAAFFFAIFNRNYQLGVKFFPLTFP